MEKIYGIIAGGKILMFPVSETVKNQRANPREDYAVVEYFDPPPYNPQTERLEEKVELVGNYIYVKYEVVKLHQLPIDGILRKVVHGDINQISGTTSINNTNTAPSINNGTQLFSTEIIPESVDSKFIIDFSFMATVNTNGRSVLIALFRNNTFLTLCQHWDNAAFFGDVSMHLVDTPNTTDSIVYSARVGIGGGNGTWYIGQSSNRSYGRDIPGSWSIKEVLLNSVPG